MNAMTMSRPNKYNEELFYVIWVITITFFIQETPIHVYDEQQKITTLIVIRNICQ